MGVWIGGPCKADPPNPTWGHIGPWFKGYSCPCVGVWTMGLRGALRPQAPYKTIETYVEATEACLLGPFWGLFVEDLL